MTRFSCTGGDSLGSMSAIASLASPSPSMKCGQFRMISTAPQFAKWAQMPAGTLHHNFFSVRFLRILENRERA
jgi:hypothetical protein